MGESDRLLTILTVEHGLIRVIAPGARKHKSRLAGRSSQFVVNELFIIQGKRLDKLVQAETVRSFPGLATDLARLTASQYLAELVLCQALTEHPQAELFTLLIQHLQALEQAVGEQVLVCLSRGIFALLMLAGLEPELERCSVSQGEIGEKLPADWRGGFSAVSGGVVSWEHVGEIRQFVPGRVREPRERYAGNRASGQGAGGRSHPQPQTQVLTAQELILLRSLKSATAAVDPSGVPASGDLPAGDRLAWQRIERLLRQYAEYHFDRSIRSAQLMDTCFPTSSTAVPPYPP